ncbi:MAG: electron transfer flavoprotein subunit alpha/FixB family protein [Candidatus Limnocylindrales bacterium]
MGAVLVYATTAAGVADDVSLQALALAREFAAGGPVHALVIDAAAAEGLGAWGASHVHVATHPALGSVAPDAVARVLDDLATRLNADAVIGPGTEHGNTVVARAAARAGLPFAANCTGVVAGSPVTITRLRWGGSLMEEAAIHAPRAMLTVAPHTVASSRTGGVATVQVYSPELDEADLAVRAVARMPAATAGISLAEAKVVVTGGRGVGSAEGFAPIVELAGLLGGAVGCSRAVTISGWRPHTDQVGQTGKTVAPNLYFAVGISGAIQHMAGCKGAKKILVINKDREAPIMAAADYAVIGDLHQVLPAINAEIRRVRGA